MLLGGGRRRAAALLLASLLVLTAGIELAAQPTDSPSPSPSPDQVPTLDNLRDVSSAGGPTPGGGDMIDGAPLPYNYSEGGFNTFNQPLYSDNQDGMPLLTPISTTIKGREFYYEIPVDPIGLVVFFHGCYHNAYDFWPEQEACTECRGLPEEMSHTKQILSLGYAFAAMNSLDRRESGQDIKCFTWERDRDTAVPALRQLPKELGLEGLPIIVGGVSSGASFAGRLPNDMPGELSGIISEVLAVNPDGADYNWGDWPPTAFVSMVADKGTADRIARNQQVLLDNGIPAQTIEVYDRRVYPTYFSDQTPEISPALSEKTVEALKQLGVLDEQGWLNDDPRQGFKGLSWRSRLAQLVPELDGSDPTNSLKADSSDISELLNVAYGNHEIDADYTTAILRWFEQGGAADLNELAAEYVIRKPALLSPERLGPNEKPATAGDPPVYSRRRRAM